MYSAHTSRADLTRTLRIFVVEDEPGLRFLIAVFFGEEAGFDVVEAGSADDAIRLLATDAAFDCVFTDVRMPGQADGLQLAQHVLKTHPELKVVMTSGNLLPGEQLDDVPFFAKPYDCTGVADFIRGLVYAA